MALRRGSLLLSGTLAGCREDRRGIDLQIYQILVLDTTRIRSCSNYNVSDKNFTLLGLIFIL